MAKPIAIGVITVITLFSIGLFQSENAYSQMDALTKVKIPGTLAMENLRVNDKGTYYQIKVDVVVRSPGIEIGEFSGFNVKTGTWLINENGKIYYPQNSRLNKTECTDKGLDMLGFYGIDGKSGGKGSFTLCFDVDKKYKTYTLQVGGKKLETFSFDSNLQIVHPNEGKSCVRLLTQAEKEAHPDRIFDGVDGTIVDGKCIPIKSKLSRTLVIEDNNLGFNLENMFLELIDMIQSLFSDQNKEDDGSNLTETNKELTFQELMWRYPSPNALKGAVSRGELDYKLLREDIKEMIDTAPKIREPIRYPPSVKP